MPIADIVAQKKEAAIQEIVTKQQAKDQLEDQAHTLVATTNATNTVLTAYLAYTGLPPSQPDLTTWVDFLVKGGSTTTLIATLAKNPAYLANTAGSAVNAVQYAFHNLFGREANAGDLAYWLPLATNPSFPMKLAAAASPICLSASGAFSSGAPARAASAASISSAACFWAFCCTRAFTRSMPSKSIISRQASAGAAFSGRKMPSL